MLSLLLYALDDDSDDSDDFGFALVLFAHFNNEYICVLFFVGLDSTFG